MEKANYTMQMEIYTKAIELMIKQTVREFILIRMEPNTKANEKMINKMGKAKNNGRMELNMKVSIFKGKKKEKAY